jgi:hypothetical protein
MFNIPAHLSDTTQFCDEIEQGLSFSSPGEIAAQKEQLSNEMCMSTERHNILCANLNLNPENVPYNLKQLNAMYEREKYQLQRTINKTVRRQTRRVLKLKTPEEENKLHTLQEAADNSTGEFFCKWKPLLEELTRADIALDTWADPLLKFRQKVVQELDVWRQVGKQQPEQKLVLTVSFRDQTGEQKLDIEVSNLLSVKELAKIVQKRLGIRLEKGEEIRFFTRSGPLKPGSVLNQYETERVQWLRAVRVQTETVVMVAD